MPVADVTVPDKREWETVLSKWYTTQPDTLTHSVAGWALRQWKLKLPKIAASKQPVENRNWHVNSVDMTMLKIPHGTFVRKDSDDNDANDQKVTLTRSFLLADREVTRAQFQQFIDDPDYPDAEKPNGWRGASAEYSPTEQHPVQQVNWYDAVLFCNWLSRQEGLTPSYERTGKKEKETFGSSEYDAWRVIHANGYRLPTEAEWEYACRAGTVTTFSHGNEESLLVRYAVYHASRTQVPGSKLPNAWGLFDIHGNVYEWCQDRHGAYGSDEAVTDPMGPAQGTGRVLRGGSFNDEARNVRSAYRLWTPPTLRIGDVGFRSARTYP